MDRRLTHSTAYPSSQPSSSQPSALPIPSSAIKRQSVMNYPQQSQSQSQGNNPNRMSMNPNRMSLAGPPQRGAPSSSQGERGGNGGAGAVAPGTGRRLTQMQHPTVPQGQSQGRGAGGGGGGGGMGESGYGRTPNRGGGASVMRRSSVYGAGRPSVVTPQHNGASNFFASQTKDLRPLKDPLFKKACQESIFVYFQHRPRAPQISQKTLISPTQHEFQMMFKFLITEGIDEDYVFGRGGKKFEEECIGILKDLKYPSVDGLSRTAITAPGTPQGWPSLLAMLMWLVDLSQVKRNWLECEVYADYELLPANEIPLDAPSLYELFLWEYMVNAYTRWSQGFEESPEEDQRLEENFDRKYQSWYDEVEGLEKGVIELRAELAQLSAEPSPLIFLNDEFGKYESDKTKFDKYIQYYTGKMQECISGNAAKQDKIAQLQSEASTLRNEKASLLAAVKAQGLSPEEVTRLHTDRESLARSFEDLRSKVAEAQKAAYEREMAVSKRGDNLESVVGEYMAGAYRLSLHEGRNGSGGGGMMGMDGVESPLGSSGVGNGIGGLELGLNLNLAGTTPDEILEGDVGGMIRPRLMMLAERKREDHRRIVDETIKVEDELDRLGQLVEGLKEEAEMMQGRVQATSEQADSARQIATQESAELAQQQHHLEKEIASTKAMSRQALLAAESKVETLKIEQGKLFHRINKLREDTNADITAQVTFIQRFKDLSGQALESLKRFAELN